MLTTSEWVRASESIVKRMHPSSHNVSVRAARACATAHMTTQRLEQGCAARVCSLICKSGPMMQATVHIQQGHGAAPYLGPARVHGGPPHHPLSRRG